MNQNETKKDSAAMSAIENSWKTFFLSELIFLNLKIIGWCPITRYDILSY